MRDHDDVIARLLPVAVLAAGSVGLTVWKGALLAATLFGPRRIHELLGPEASVIEAGDATARRCPRRPGRGPRRRSRQGHLAGAAVVASKTDGPAGTAVTIAVSGGAVVAIWRPFAGTT